jgi:hypothetical protein
MADQVALQANVDSISIRGLSAFSSVLAAVSADNVAPMALIQLEALGSLFIISGPLAALVPDALQRSSSFKLEKIGIMVGWRKGDAAHYLSRSAGGQAAALLCLCLINLFDQRSLGQVFHQMC